MSNHSRPAKPPLPLLKRTRSGSLPATRRDRESAELGRKPSETARSGTIAAVRPPAASVVPRPTSNVLRRLNPAFKLDDDSEWEPRGTLVGDSYRDAMPTIPSPEVLESRLLAEFAETEAVRAVPQVEPVPTGVRAQFEPAHSPSVRVSPIIELEKAPAVIVDPLAIVSGASADPEPVEDYPSASELLLALPETAPAPASKLALPVEVDTAALRVDEALPVEVDDVALRAEEDDIALPVESDIIVEELPLSGSGASQHEPEPEPSERSRITRPPARRRRRWRPLRALLLGAVLVGGVSAAWHRYPAQCERGWQEVRAQLGVWGATLHDQWSNKLRALGY